ncbi:acyl carrier protein [Phragmitibacter flavus]|uniref:Acyl carrier protein n=1 Tax=Phragmitibacter flavus TaxID=2576071 RepID=A0A5R8K9U3_9BACT|nr:phosphopantetheine-binding protein [Phragmitibacter flavus]TLD69078.1 acyl carrier protein [Phragmitibacter flavus]
MDDTQTLKLEIKQALIEELMLPQSADEIADETPLFGQDGLGLDSVDALQLTVAIEKRFGLKLADAEAARKAMGSVNDLAAAIEESRLG